VSDDKYSEVTDEDLAKMLGLEREVHPDETPEARARRMLKEGADAATASIVQIAVRGSTERLRLDAAKYILDRVLGKPGEDISGRDHLQELLEEMVDGAEKHANGKGKKDPLADVRGDTDDTPDAPSAS
jgi:hypothetical protein